MINQVHFVFRPLGICFRKIRNQLGIAVLLKHEKYVFFFRNSAINQLQILLNVTNNINKSRISTTYINIFIAFSLILPTAPTVLAREEHIFIELNEFMLRNCANGQKSQ